jgi:hypothetical protein
LDLTPYRSFLPYTFSALATGFKYLGYQLKTGAHRADDWYWLLEKMEKKIGLWCNKWLSLGGLYILIKSVLESQPIYWMSLEIIPCSVLNKVWKLMFNFLWNGNSETKHYHLCRWDVLSRPKFCGGWGFRNLFHFNTALNANTLWRVLNREGIWHNIIKDKYLHNTTIINWFRSVSFKHNSTSRIWNSLLKSVHLITHWLSWVPGSGHLISIGRDQILGLGDKSFLSHDILEHLKKKKITVLAQAKNHFDHNTLTKNWFGSVDLGLTGALAAEWDLFHRALIGAGATIRDTTYQLMWT